jgi:DNA-binding CsgD family transcriptional regulator
MLPYESTDPRHPDGARAYDSRQLTRREREIAELIAEGLSNEQIADRLVLRRGTVANHVAHILDKLGLQSRVQVAVTIAVQKTSRRSERVLALLERLREVDSASLNEALQHATDVLAATFAADKVDAFLHDPATARLIAVGTSATPMGELERALGLDQLPVLNGGRVARIFQDKRPFLDGHVEHDPEELLGVRRDLGVRSTIGVPLEIADGTSGVLTVTSARPDHFTSEHLSLLQFVAYWIGLVAREHTPRANGRDGSAATARAIPVARARTVE